jgi:hypothetical protein
MKIALCRPRDLPRLIDMVYGQELACIGRLRDLKQLSEREAAGETHEWSRLMRILSRDAEVASWKARIEWLQSARELLERLLEDSEQAHQSTATERRSANQQPTRGRVGRLRAL